MMLTNEVFIDAFGRVKEAVRATVKGLDETSLTYRPNEQTNTIAWLVWHLTRIQDDHIADAAGREQVWTAAGWADKFDLPFDPGETGYGHTSDQVAAVRASAEQLLNYHDAVHDQTVKYLKSLSEADYGKVVDNRWDPPVTLAVRLVSIISDDLQHAGQAAYVRGLLK